MYLNFVHTIALISQLAGSAVTKHKVKPPASATELQNPCQVAVKRKGFVIWELLVLMLHDWHVGVEQSLAQFIWLNDDHLLRNWLHYWRRWLLYLWYVSAFNVLDCLLQFLYNFIDYTKNNKFVFFLHAFLFLNLSVYLFE